MYEPRDQIRKSIRVLVQVQASTDVRVHSQELFSLFLNKNTSCGFSKEPSHSHGSFEHLKHMLKLTDKKISIFILKTLAYQDLCTTD